MAVTQPYRLFLPCAPGLEQLLLEEVRGVGGVRPEVVAGGLELEANQHVVDRCLLELGLALDVRVRLGSFFAPTFDLLVRRVTELPWGDYVGSGQDVEVKARTKRSRLQHTGAVEQRVRTGIQAVLGSLATDEGVEPWRAFIRLEGDRATVSLSLAGAPLSRRGYRLSVGKAPLREDLARAVLRIAGWTPEDPLVDPFCGSGTILVEAARIARAIPPGWHRSFHWQRAPTFDPERWARIRSGLEAQLRDAPAPIRGRDRDEGAVAAARDNAARAGVGATIDLEVAALGKFDFSDLEPGWWISNPPFGHRVKGGDGLRSLYQTIGKRFSELEAGWRIGLLTDEPKLAHGAGLELQSRILLDHGGRKVRFYTN